MAKHFPVGLDNRMRDKDGDIREKRGDTHVGTLRDEYGDKFAPGVRADATLATIKQRLGAETLNDVLREFGIKK